MKDKRGSKQRRRDKDNKEHEVVLADPKTKKMDKVKSCRAGRKKKKKKRIGDRKIRSSRC